MRDRQFGRIENMRVEGGQPLLGVGARLVRIARFDRTSRRTLIPDEQEFELKQEICRLFDELTQLQHCIVVRLEFRHGLPLQLETVPLSGAEGEQAAVPNAETFSTRGSRVLGYGDLSARNSWEPPKLR